MLGSPVRALGGGQRGGAHGGGPGHAGRACATGRADNWRALVGIAGRAGGSLARARPGEAAVALSGGGGDDSNEAPGLDAARRHRSRSSRDGRPTAWRPRPSWPAWSSSRVGRGRNGGAGSAITTNGLAKLLKPFEIKPTVRREGSNVFRGYLTRHFDDAFARYLPSDPLHRCKPQDSGALSDPAPVTPVTDGSAPRVAKFRHL